MADHATGLALAGTGIEGLDIVLRGGLPAERLYLVEGDPGTGKTTLALQFLLEGARRGEKTLYVTLSETESELAQVASSLGWSLEPLSVCDLSATRETNPESEYTFFLPSEVELAATTNVILERVEHTNPTRVVLDSLSEMRLLARDPLRYRRQVLALKQFFTGRSCTVLLLDDRTSEANDRQLESIAHGVLRLETVTPGYGADRRRIRIAKLRGVNFVGGYHDFVIETGGLKVFHRLDPARENKQFAPEELASGTPGLDTLLGGGVTLGTSTLVIGPAGTGKTTIALAYAAAEAARGGSAAVFSFDEGVSSMIDRADALGLAASTHVKSGRLKVREINPAELSPGQFAHAVRESVEQDGARVIVIDSLNGYLTSMPSDYSLHAHLHELISYLRKRGVAVIILMVQHGFVGAGMTTPEDVSYLSDAVVLLRYFEVAGQIRKAISVLKKRTRSHEDTIRELRIDPCGLRVGEVLKEFRGVLTGAPEYYGDESPLLKDRNRGSGG